MKKIILIFLLAIPVTFVNVQGQNDLSSDKNDDNNELVGSSFNRWSVELNVGNNKPSRPFTSNLYFTGDPTNFVDIAEFKAETLIYANAKSLGGYNSKITIYNQYKNLMAKTFNDIEVNNLIREYKGLKYRMRIEVSKRIQRKEFTVKEFGIFDIFGEYAESFKNYILENILDMETIDKIYEELASGLVDKLEAHRTFSRNFNYENFIYREIDNIYDYEILRRAVKKLNNNVKTRENAITAIRKVLLEYEREKGIIVMNTYEAILDIRETIENSFQD